MKKIITIITFLNLFSCHDENKNDLYKPQIIGDTAKKNLSYVKSFFTINSLNDTEKVILQTYDYLFTLRYYQNKPQFITIDNSNIGAGVKMNEFSKQNKGAYMSFNPASNNLESFGIKYINGRNGIDIIMSPNGSEPKLINVWKEYTNDGMQYDFSKIGKGELIVYEYKSGSIVDSFVLKKNLRH